MRATAQAGERASVSHSSSSWHGFHTLEKEGDGGGKKEETDETRKNIAGKKRSNKNFLHSRLKCEASLHWATTSGILHNHNV